MVISSDLRGIRKEDVLSRTSIVDLIGRDIPLTRAGREAKGCCPFHTERTPSFTVVDKKGFFHCFGCGAHGDAIDWLMRYHNMDFTEALTDLAAAAGLLSGIGVSEKRKSAAPRVLSPDEEIERKREAEIERARKLWREAIPGAETPVESWLAFRGIPVAAIGGVPPSLRFHRELPYFIRRKGERGKWEEIAAPPAMIAGIQGPDGRVSAVHITWLKPDGRGKADLPPHPDTGEIPPRRKVRGRKEGGTIRFAAAGETLVLGEGIESVLSARVVLPDLPAWSAVDLGNLSGGGLREEPPTPHPTRPNVFLPSPEPDMGRGLSLPDVVRRVILLGEASNGDAHAYARLFERAKRRYARMGLEVRAGVPPVGDLNDWLKCFTGGG